VNAAATRLQPAHRSQPVLEPAVSGLDRVVSVLLGVVPGRRPQLIQYAGIDRRGVGDDFSRDHLECAQRSGEEPAGRRSVPAGRDQHVDNLAVLINRPVDVAPEAVDLHVGLIDEPPAARRVPGEASGLGQQWS
jgi:hypothetical protein